MNTVVQMGFSKYLEWCLQQSHRETTEQWTAIQPTL